MFRIDDLATVPGNTRREDPRRQCNWEYLMSRTVCPQENRGESHIAILMRATERKTQRRLRSCEAGQPIFTRWHLPGSPRWYSQVRVAQRLRGGRHLADQLHPPYQAGGSTTLLKTTVRGKCREKGQCPVWRRNPCEAKPKNVGENFARELWMSKIQIGLWQQSKSYFKYWRIAKNGDATRRCHQCHSMKNLST